MILHKKNPVINFQIEHPLVLVNEDYLLSNENLRLFEEEYLQNQLIIDLHVDDDHRIPVYRMNDDNDLEIEILRYQIEILKPKKDFFILGEDDELIKSK